MITALADNVRSLHNVGAIFRTADGAGLNKLYLSGITGTPPHREIRKVALGAEENVLWEYVKESTELLQKLKRDHVEIIVLESTTRSLPYNEIDYQHPLCLVVGHEYDGVSPQVLALADKVVEIPMHGTKASLNVAVAFGIAIYEIIKSR